MGPTPSMTGGAGGAAGPSTASSSFGLGFNSSGWTVNTGSGSASGAVSPWMIAAEAAVVVVWMITQRRGR